jgi:hypothetical protein
VARCEEGYRCQVCGEVVEALTDSDLYLTYVIGETDPESLHLAPERHLRCNPVLAQFIVDPEFEPIWAEGEWDKRKLDSAFVRQREALVTRGYRRLRDTAGTDRPILEYPLPEIQAEWQRRADPETGVP